MTVRSAAMLWFVSLLALAGCGRVGFDAVADGSVADEVTADVLLGHDEDGDGTPDAVDLCPHLPALAHADLDGDNVGDDCDPNPAQAIDTIALFATMRAGDQPFTKEGNGVWSQLDDALRYDGALDGNGTLYGLVTMPMTLGNVAVTVGIDITAVIPGASDGQNQLALRVADQPPLYFVELNQVPPTFDVAAITQFDGTNFGQVAADDLLDEIHPGRVTLQTTQRVGIGVRFNVGWPGEPYEVEVMDAVYQGATSIRVNSNALHFEIRYLCVITST